MEPSSFLLDEREPLNFDLLSSDLRAHIEKEEHQTRLLGCLRQDLSNTMILLAGCASLANFATARPEFERIARSQIEKYIPPEPRSITVILGQLVGDSHGSAMAAALLRLCSMLTLARSASCPTSVGIEEKWTIDELADLLSQLCVSALDVLHKISSRITEAGNIEFKVEEGVSGERLAVAAGCGGWPCVDNDGLLQIPGWVERRSRSRARVNGKWQLVSGDTSHEVSLVDVSTRGIGIDDAPPLVEGQQVRLVPAIGPALSAEVVWQVGHRSGLQFCHPLTPVEMQRILDQ